MAWCQRARQSAVLFMAGAILLLLEAVASPHAAQAAPLRLSESPTALVVNTTNHRVYAANGDADTVSVIDTSTGAYVSLTVGRHPCALAWDQYTNKIFVANYYSASVSVIDCSSNAVSSVAVGSNPAAIAIDTALHRVYVANSGSPSLSVLDSSGSLITSVSLDAQPVRVAVDSVSHRVFATLSSRNTVAIVDGISSQVATVAVASSPEAVAVDQTTGKAYVANSGSGSVSVIDGATHTVYSMLVGASPSSVAVDEARSRVYVTNAYTSTLSAIDTTTNVVHSITVGDDPDFACVDAALNEICVINRGNSSISIVSGASLTAMTVPLQGSPGRMILDSNGHLAYVSTETYDEDNEESIHLLERIPLNGLVVPSKIKVYVGSHATLKFVGGSGAVTWSSSSRTVATVSKGVITGVKAGTATISATRGGVKSRCTVSVVKRKYTVSLSRSVSSGRGYINLKAKTASGAAAKYRVVKFYREGAYLGKATTDRYGKAHIRVTKNRGYKTYKAVVSGDARYSTTSVEEELRFMYRVYAYSGTDIWYDSVYLTVGNYRMYVYGDGNVYGVVGIIKVDGSDGDWADFRVLKNYTFGTEGISMEDGGQVEVVVYRLM